MKRNPFMLCGFLFLLSLSLSSCQKHSNAVSTFTSAPPSDAWRDVYFSETHFLSSANPCVLYDVSIDTVFDKTYPQSSSKECLLIECTVEHIFFQSPPVDSSIHFSSTGDSIFLWVDVTGYDSATISLLSDTFESFDSAIIFGYQIEPHIVQNSSLCKQLESDLNKEQISYYDWDGLSLLKLPPCVKVYNLEEWPVIPLVNDIFSVDNITSVIGANNMAFSFDSTNPDGLQYFKAGDDKEAVYEALDQFVSEFWQ